MDGLKRSFALPPLAAAIVERIDGRRTVDAIFTDIARRDAAVDRTAFDQAFQAAYRVLNGLNLLLLRIHDASRR
jgi:hypothetical protein